MKVEILDIEVAKFYTAGSLGYVLDCLQEQGTFMEYAKWLKTEPVCSFMNSEDWTISNAILSYSEDDEDKEYYPVTAMIITDSGEPILHSVHAGMSFLFKVYDNNKIHALYID